MDIATLIPYFLFEIKFSFRLPELKVEQLPTVPLYGIEVAAY